MQKGLILFWRKGFNATSMDDLVKYLGISRASFYSTFGNKRAFFEKVFEQYRKENETRIQAFFDTQSSIKEGLTTLFLNAITDTFEDGKVRGCLVVNCTTEFLPNDTEMFQILATNRIVFQKLFEGLIEKGKVSKEFSQSIDSESIAAYLFTFYSGLNIVGKLAPKEGELKQIIDNGLSVLV